MRFSVDDGSPSHGAWYDTIAKYYDHLFDSERSSRAPPFLHDVFRRHGPVRSVLDIACGTFALDVPLLRRGYGVVGRDLSEAMVRAARRNLREAGLNADVGPGDMRDPRTPETFDAVVCLGSSFNHLATSADARRALRAFRACLRPRGLLVLDVTNFEPWIRNPMNARAEVDYSAADGTRIAVFSLNDQDLRAGIHVSRFLTILGRRGRFDVRFSEGAMRIWDRASLDRELRGNGFLPVEWWGDLRLGARYERRKSPRLIAIARRAADLTPRAGTRGTPSRRASRR